MKASERAYEGWGSTNTVAENTPGCVHTAASTVVLPAAVAAEAVERMAASGMLIWKSTVEEHAAGLPR